MWDYETSSEVRAQNAVQPSVTFTLKGPSAAKHVLSKEHKDVAFKVIKYLKTAPVQDGTL